ncbi:MAG: mannose-1-phosphate guanylyltransferase [Bacteroidales bacterium]|nr:mannose-1-phosphate guanylyltransferase [Bacteroidales bacterium]
MKDPHYFCVIMAGGLGTRFWPISRQSRPKQFQDFSKSGKSFLKLAYDRACEVVPEENIIVVSLERFSQLVQENLPELPAGNLLLEPYNRNTASCIAYATYAILKRDPQAVVLVTPADQVIGDSRLFTETVLSALDYSAQNDVLLTLGILPRRADTNFGYIQTDGPMTDGTPLKVKTFTEKPSKELAQVFIDSGEFLWNAGIFIWKASVIAGELERYAPDVTAQWNGWEQYISTPLEREYLNRIYADMPRTSIDYAVMEKSQRVMAIPSFFEWNDLGNWSSLYEYFSNSEGNAVKINGDSLLKDNKGLMMFSSRKDKLVAVKGLKDYTVIDTNDVLVICPRDENTLKGFLSELSAPEFEKYR